jgi:N-acetylglucosaminyldiphosphoundecaprenol N-acetyl-beta-D-mannosaminyltransferase
MMKRYPILRIWVDAVNMEQALDKVSEFVENGERPHVIFASNPEKTFSVPRNPFLYEMFRKADLLIPDGIGMVIASRLLHGIKLNRVPGCELMQNICELSARKGYKIFIYGAKDDVSKLAVEHLEKRFPDIRIVGRSDGYVPDEKMDELLERINESGAQILFLALGSPKQEQWISKYQSRLKNIRVCQGIGGTLDVLSGKVRRAPGVYCYLGLEWFYRLISEPKRLTRQKVLPMFAYQVFRQRFFNRLSGCV